MPKLWLKIFLLPPELLRSHVQGYADLASEEWTLHVSQLKKRVLLGVLGALCLLLGLACGGMAVLLWGALPELNPQRSWVLLALPLFLCLVGLALAWRACLQKMTPLFPKLQHQLQLDKLSLQQAAKP